MEKNICYGCDDGERTPLEADHYHQYINMLGEARSCWWISGNVYDNITDARNAIVAEYECSMRDAAEYLCSIAKKYN